ncbi:hypothetical protein RB2150_04743 [Rhodobacterales bacterium HTCC2150]|nr:hypothetical protein RB2150_04743 [Rhodobacterales bacterium HTCC2150] [Rhodobacteraceae bacterium HTCC2150]
MKKRLSSFYGSSRKTPRFGLLAFTLSFFVITATAFAASQVARSVMLYQEEEIDPVIAGSDLDDIPALMRGNRPSVTTSLAYGETKTPRVPRMCEMPKDYFEKAELDVDLPVGYTRRNGYVRKFKDRRGFLTEREMRAAKVAWHYFEKFTQPTTGLANSVGNFPSTTMWDTASYISGLVSAYELCLIEKPEFDDRVFRLLTTFKGLKLFRGELPNKVYHTKTGAQVDYTNKPGEVGFSALDIGRFLVWMRILKNRYPYLGNTIDSVLLKWDYSNAISSEGLLVGAYIDKKTKEIKYAQEGRLGYEEYAAKGFALWGFRPLLAHRAEPFLTASIFGVAVPYDGRDPRIFHSQNYVVTESYLLDGLEFGFDMPHGNSSKDRMHSDGWRAEFADRIYLVQEQRYTHTGFLTARSEHNVKGPPYFTYDTIFSDGYPWNTVTPRGDYAPDHSAVSAKAAMGLWSLWDTPYTDDLFEAIVELYNPENGMYEGLYEGGQGKIEIYTANINGIILGSLLHKVQGKLLTPYLGETEVWYTAFREQDARERKHLPDPFTQDNWLPALRHAVQSETKL